MQAQSIYYVWEVYDGIGLRLLAEWISTDKQPNYQKLLSASAFVPYISWPDSRGRVKMFQQHKALMNIFKGHPPPVGFQAYQFIIDYTFQIIQ